MTTTEIGENTAHIINCFCFKINYTLAYQTIYLIYFLQIVFIWSSLLQKCKKQSRPTNATLFCNLSEKKQLTNLQKQLLKNLFSSVYVICKTYFDECFLFHVIGRCRLFSGKVFISTSLHKQLKVCNKKLCNTQHLERILNRVLYDENSF